MCDWKPNFSLDIKSYKCLHKNYGKSKDGTKDLCIYHSDREDKDSELFYRGIKKIYKSKKHDFRGFIFPKTFNFKTLKEDIKADHLVFANANFLEAVFLCDVNLSGAEFTGPGGTYFSGATFSGQGPTIFRGATFFGPGATYFSGAQFTGPGPTIFSGATFSGPGATIFRGAQFTGQGPTNFSGASFSGQGPTIFRGVTFSGPGATIFRGATFTSQGPTIFHGATFTDKSPTDFSGAKFSGQGKVQFSGRTFEDVPSVDFHNVAFENPNKVMFDGVDLNRVRFLSTDLSSIRFSNVFWTDRKYGSSSYRGRLKVFDETYQVGGLGVRRGQQFDHWLKVGLFRLHEKAIKELKAKDTKRLKKALLKVITRVKINNPEEKERNHYEVYNLYNQLIRNYEKNNRYHEAGDFFVGMMEMRRRGDFEKRTIRALLYPYKWISLYGERPLRAFGWLLGSILLFGLLNLAAGVDPVETNSNLDSIKMGVFSIKAFIEPGFWTNYLQAVFTALHPITLGKVEAAYTVKDALWGPLLRIGETVTGALFISLFLLAMNRKFRRTKD